MNINVAFAGLIISMLLCLAGLATVTVSYFRNSDDGMAAGLIMVIVGVGILSIIQVSV